ncbi:non-homologous end-joining DNA ligase [Pseudalkalibacillus caeni]|uniref:non-homologous end-joining DNA ligase n=1 Tax=Exobacillus caeni TaxID=2574798 RepID=UPI00268CBB86
MDIKLLKPMLPTLVFDKPEGKNWVYEIKLDGYRAMVYWTETDLQVISRNLKPLTDQFPEVVEALQRFSEIVKQDLPIILDGELCILLSKQKADFEKLQMRGRLRNKDKIQISARKTPAVFCSFDMLMVKGEFITNKLYRERKERLKCFFEQLSFCRGIEYVPFEEDWKKIWTKVKKTNGEGVIAKKTTSKWVAGKRTNSWLKIKNWKTGSFFLTAYDTENGYFYVGVMRNGQIYEVGLFSHGISGDEKEALVMVIKKNSTSMKDNLILIKPGIVIDLSYLELYKDQLRQPRFNSFRFDLSWEDCTWEALQMNEQM